MAGAGTWTVERIERLDGRPPRMPFLISITNADGKHFHVRTHGPWPAPGKSLFAVRSEGLAAGERGTMVETVSVLRLQATHGKPNAQGKSASTITLALDRPSRKHCSFLVTVQRHDNGTKQEVIYLRTEQSIKSHRSRGYLQPTALRNIPELVIDTREQYPWRFTAQAVQRGALRAGDYAMRVQEKTLAVIERKSFPNMLANLANLASYHAHLLELASYPMAALVIEAQYRDFLDPAKTKPMATTRCARALADIAARHPNLQVIFAGSRKDANLWAAHFFEAAAAVAAGDAEAEPLQGSLLEAAERGNTGGTATEIRHAILFTLPSPLSLAELQAAFPARPKAELQRTLRALRDEGKLRSKGVARATRWVRNQDPPPLATPAQPPSPPAAEPPPPATRGKRGGSRAAVEAAIASFSAPTFRAKDVATVVPALTGAQISAALVALEADGQLTRTGERRTTVWRRRPDSPSI